MSNRPGMHLSDLANSFRGVTVTIVTPFRPISRALDPEGLRANVRHLSGKGLSVIVPAGNTGEYHSLSPEEIRMVMRVTVEEVANREAVVAGVAGDLATAVGIAQDAQTMGADGIMIHEPNHTFATRDGLFDYYLELCQSIDFGVVIYKRSSRLPDDVIIRLARECTNIVAIKYALSDVPAYLRLSAEAPERVTCACGSAERWALPFSIAGTTGFTSGISNFAPELSLEYWRAVQTDRAKAFKLWQRLSMLEDLRAWSDSQFNVPVVKHAMDLLGLAAGPVRPPLSQVSASMGDEITRVLEDWGLPLSIGDRLA